MVGALGGIAVAVAGEARVRAIEAEEKGYRQIASSIDDLVEAGVDEDVFVVDTNVSGLPEYDHSIIGNIRDHISSFYYSLMHLGPPHKSHKESTKDYLRGIFQPYQAKHPRLYRYYQKNDILVVNVRDLNLLFDISPGTTVSEQKEWLFFNPEYPLDSNTCTIIRKTEVRMHTINLRYRGFYKSVNFTEGLTAVRPTDKVIYK